MIITSLKITNLKELEKRRTLKSGDIVYFTVGEETIKYRTEHWCLNHYTFTEETNSKIFTLLGIDKTDKYKLATKIYGYSSYDGDWPICNGYDYPALTRLVKKLYLIIEGEPVPIKTRWELLDL